MLKCSIIIYNNYFNLKIQGESSIENERINNTLTKLHKAISYVLPTYVKAVMVYAKKGWSKPKNLIYKYLICREFSEKENVIRGVPLGLFRRVYKVLEEDIKNIHIEVFNKYKHIHMDNKITLDENRLKNKYGLRDYQVRGLVELVKKNRGILKAVTGSGKTRMLSTLVKEVGVPTLVLVDANILAEQWYDTFKKMNIDATKVIEGKVIPGKSPVVIAMYQSLYDMDTLSEYTKRGPKEPPSQELMSKLKMLLHPERLNTLKQILPGFPDSIEMVIADEAHITAAFTYYGTILKFSPKYLYGCTATPYRKGEEILLLESLYSQHMSTVKIEDVKDYLVIPEYISIIQENYLNRQLYDDKYTEDLQVAEFRHLLCSDPFRLVNIRRVLSALSKTDTQFMIVCGYMFLVELIKDICDKLGLTVDIIAGKLNKKIKDREAVKQKLKNKELQGVITTTTMDVGVDCPTLQAVILAYPFNSKVKAIQRAGRITRDTDGKKYSLLLDIFDIKVGRAKASYYSRRSVLTKEFDIQAFSSFDNMETLEEDLIKHIKNIQNK